MARAVAAGTLLSVRSVLAAATLATLIGGCATPPSAPVKPPEPIVVTAAAIATRDELPGLADLPRGWMVTRETLDDADEVSANAAEAGRLRERGFLSHRQREFENRYGGGPRELVVSVSRYSGAMGASAGVADNVAEMTARAEAWDDPLRTIELELNGVDEVRAFAIDRPTQERVYLAFFRVGGSSGAVFVNGYATESGHELFLTIAKQQVRRLLGD
jgi:hypothetical protein